MSAIYATLLHALSAASLLTYGQTLRTAWSVYSVSAVGIKRKAPPKGGAFVCVGWLGL